MCAGDILQGIAGKQDFRSKGMRTCSALSLFPPARGSELTFWPILWIFTFKVLFCFFSPSMVV